MKNTFQLWPAIDLIDGKPVRLKLGDYQQKTEYNISLAETMAQFDSFAHGIHLVDLNGAKTGIITEWESLKEIRALTDKPIEFGGGIRDLATVKKLLNIGINRVIIGSKIFDSQFLAALQTHCTPDQIIIGLDCKNEQVATHGWCTVSEQTLWEVLDDMTTRGFNQYIITDIAQDGMLSGPAISLYTKIIQKYPHINCFASGGVSNMADLENLKKIPVTGVVFGKAWYEGLLPAAELKNI